MAGPGAGPASFGLWRAGTGSLARLVHRRRTDAGADHHGGSLALHPTQYPGLGACRRFSQIGDADYVQENTPEKVEIKRAVFARLDAIARPDTILASSTSALLPSSFTQELAGRARCIVVHPLNPPYLIPAAEVVPAPWTDAHVIERTAAFLRGAGHAPIVMKRELEGFVMNRLQGALLEEAFRLVESGHASVEDIDIGLRQGLAFSW